MSEPNQEKAFAELYDIIVRLRSPGGCPWDIEQTPQSMRSALTEECYEAIEAVNEANPEHVCEELGDLLFNVLLVAYMYEQANEFTLNDMLRLVSDKIIRRHPHVFANQGGEQTPRAKITTSEQVLVQWDAIKANAEGRKKKHTMDEIARGLPPLKRAYKLQQKAAKQGFDWADANGVWEKLREEETEAKLAANDNNEKELENELGDVLFTAVNLCRHYKIDPEQALLSANAKWTERFSRMEDEAEKAGKVFADLTSGEKELLWEKAKKTLT